MIEPVLNRDRRALLESVSRGRVFTANGMIFRLRGRLKSRCDVMIRAFETAGWVQLGDDGTYELTGDGRAALDGAP